ncbi:hypothetical protein LYSHEL_26230 [Lysobacter helvus]|uniref:Lipoprotein n=2 Tax=Lysobacteraceae TaxID=32033 RepID=A0ABN6G1G9_9GAMM|nr:MULTISPECIES: hypothetical protein [Lysobacter]BCT93598.1 hypothetical protein LYSCAS_26220 [Lysobacter caseinilyticus]BCT96752.1 hypothetical protein LYSHEL_26230 [Lysobacter helvus]
MRTGIPLSLSLSLCTLLAVSCSGGGAHEAQALVEAAEASVQYAVRDKVDLRTYQLKSVHEFGNGNSDLWVYGVPRFPYELAVAQRLKGKRYWQACYTHRNPEMAAAMYCYFLDRQDLTLLAIYRVK